MSLYSIGLALAAKKKAEEEKKEVPTPEAPKMKEEKTIQEAEQIARKVRAGEYVPLKQITWAARDYPELFTAEPSKHAESKQFYEEAGYPQYAGKYDAPEVPEGYEVKTITKTKEGLKLQYQYVGKPRSITEMFMTWQPTALGFQLPAKKTLKEAEVSRFATPGRIVAGLVSTIEAPVYSVGRLAGFETPPIPVTVSGGLISSGVESVFAGKPVASKELTEAFRHPEYAFGSITGDILASLVIGAGVEKVIVKPIQTKAKSWLTTKYMEKGRLAWKGRTEAIVMKVTGAKPYVARGEISLPQLTGKLNLQRLQASQVAWEMTKSPRMGGVWLRNIGVAPTKTTVLPHLISRGGVISIGYLRELSYEEPLWKRGLLPFVTQKQVTRMGILPYVPKAVAVTGKKGISQLAIGLGITTLAQVRPEPTRRIETMQKPLPLLTIHPEPKRREKQVLLPKLWQPTLAYEREKFKPLTIERLEPKQKERAIPVLRLPTLRIPTSELKAPSLQIPKQATITIQKTAQIPSIPIPTPTIPTTPTPLPPPFRVPHGGRDVSRGRRGLFGAWFKRTHPIKTAEQMLQTFTGARRKLKKRKKKKRKRRKK